MLPIRLSSIGSTVQLVKQKNRILIPSNKLGGGLVKVFFTAWRTEVVGLALISTLESSRFFLDIHSADRVFHQAVCLM